MIIISTEIKERRLTKQKKICYNNLQQIYEIKLKLINL